MAVDREQCHAPIGYQLSFQLQVDIWAARHIRRMIDDRIAHLKMANLPL
jgi:hypothetical protein